MSNQRWFVVIPPIGAARTVALHTLSALQQSVGTQQCKSIDSNTYLAAFTQLLKNPDETMAVDLFNQSLAISCLDFQATHCLVFALSPVTLFTLQLLQKQKIITVHWFYEDYRKATYWNSVIVGYDHFFAIQRGPIESLCQQIGTAFHFLPTACSLEPAAPPSSERIFDIAFIGIPSSYRAAALETLLAQGHTIAIAGSGWDGYRGSLEPSIVNATWTNEVQSAQILAQAKIGINLSVDAPTAVNDVHISPRVYDILVTGCILLTENVPLLADSLTECSYATFSTVDEAVDKAQTLLAGYREKSAERESNAQAVVKNHGYGNRVAALLGAIG